MTTTSSAANSWHNLRSSFRSCFTRPGFLIFWQLVTAWVLYPGRHTLTHLWSVMSPAERRSYDAYARFLRVGRWALLPLWKELCLLVVRLFAPTGTILLLVDDTLHHKTGRKIEGAGYYRDAVRSTSSQVVKALGLNLVVVTVCFIPRWGGEPLALPVLVRMHQKGGLTTLDLAEQMVRDIASWFPDRWFRLAGDGAYAPLIGRNLPRTILRSRMRRDAALYDLAPPRIPGRRGRPRKRGARLPSPAELAKQVTDWTSIRVRIRSKVVERLVYARQVLWYHTCPDHPVLLVIVRDPQGKEPDDFFVTDDLTGDLAEVLSDYGDRWSIEDTFRNTKQYLHREDPQSWKGAGPQRVASLSYWIYSIVWVWYLTVHGTAQTWMNRPWYPAKTPPPPSRMRWPRYAAPSGRPRFSKGPIRRGIRQKSPRPCWRCWHGRASRRGSDVKTTKVHP